jgi:hypothetical protein
MMVGGVCSPDESCADIDPADGYRDWEGEWWCSIVRVVDHAKSEEEAGSRGFVGVDDGWEHGNKRATGGER